MSYQQEQKPSDLVKILQRENVISFKKKPKVIKDTLKSQNNNQDEDNISAQSSHSGVYSEDVNRFKGKINPLPELGKEKKRFISKNLLTQEFRVNNYQQKEVRQQENLILKQKNNFLSSQNMKLKTKITTLEKQNVKMQKMLEQQPTKAKTPGYNGLTKERFRPGGENLSTKMLLKSLKKQLDDTKKENNNIKSSIKFTTISEMECERDAILEETQRLRAMLEDEQSRRLMMKINQQGMSNLEQKLSSLQERNSMLMRQNQQLKGRLKNQEEGQTKASKSSENQKNLSKTLYNIRRLLKEKQRQVEVLKEQIKTIGTINSLAMISDKNINAPHTNLQSQGSSIPRKPSMERPSPTAKTFDKRIVSKSAQKNGPKLNQKLMLASECETCKTLKIQNEALRRKIAEYESTFQSANPLALPAQPVERPKEEQIKSLTRFIEFRFKAHHLSLGESEKYLLNTENITDEQLNKEITVEQFLEIVVTEPFVVLNKRYIEIFLMQICYTGELKKGSDKIKIDKDVKITKKALLENYRKLMSPFELLPQTKQEQMFLQIAQLVTSYYQQILAAMSNRKNGEGTIAEKDLTDFFTQIELEKEYIDFIITQIILESIDLDRLNYFAFFEIFYIPQEQGQGTQNGQVKKSAQQTAIDKKKRFEVDQVVKEQDQEYEQSRSHVQQSRQKTLSRHAQESGDSYHQFGSEDSPQKNDQHQQDHEQDNEQEEYKQDEQQEKQGMEQQEEENMKKVSPPKSQQKISPVKPLSQKHIVTKKKTQKDESYVEEFEEDKMHSDEEEQKTQPVKVKKVVNAKSQPGKLVEKPYEIEDIEDEYQEEFQT